MDEALKRPNDSSNSERPGFHPHGPSIRPDSGGCVTLGTAVRNIEYRVLVNEAGQVLLDPVCTLEDLPNEKWIWENPEVRASMERALQQAARGEFEYLGSFAEFVDLATDEEG